MGHVRRYKNETDLNSLSSAVCLASAMQGGPRQRSVTAGFAGHSGRCLIDGIYLSTYK